MILITTPEVFNAGLEHPDITQTHKAQKVEKAVLCKCGRLNCPATKRHRAKLLFVTYLN